MLGNEMNFLNQHLQTTSILLQKQLDLARDSLHACSVQFARKGEKRIFPFDLYMFSFRFKENDSTTNLIGISFFYFPKKEKQSIKVYVHRFLYFLDKINMKKIFVCVCAYFV